MWDAEEGERDKYTLPMTSAAIATEFPNYPWPYFEESTVVQDCFSPLWRNQGPAMKRTITHLHVSNNDDLNPKTER